VDHIAVKVDQVNLATTTLRREYGKTGERSVVVAGT
jgi:hypothetical protein